MFFYKPGILVLVLFSFSLMLEPRLVGFCYKGHFNEVPVLFIFTDTKGGVFFFHWENPKAGFAFLGWIPKTDRESIKSTLRVLQIKSKSGFVRFTTSAFFWDKIRKKYFWQAVFHSKMLHNSYCSLTWPSNLTVLFRAITVITRKSKKGALIISSYKIY